MATQDASPWGALQRRPSATFMREYVKTTRELRSSTTRDEYSSSESDGEADIDNLYEISEKSDAESLSVKADQSISFHDTNPFSATFGQSKPLSRSSSEDHLASMVSRSDAPPRSVSTTVTEAESDDDPPSRLSSASSAPASAGSATVQKTKKPTHRRSHSNPFFAAMDSTPFSPEPAKIGEEDYNDMTEIGGLPYETWVPTGDVLRVVVQNDMDRATAEIRLAEAPPGGFLVRWSSGKDRIRVLSLKGPATGQFQHLKVMESGGKFRIPPSTVEKDLLDDLLRHFYKAENNDLLLCPLTVDVCREHRESVPLRQKPQRPASSPSTKRHSRQTSLLTVNDWDSPNCLRCGKRLNKQASKRYWCQACDVPVCGECSSRRLEANKTLRVCSMCYELNCDSEDLVLRHRPRPMPYLVACGSLVKSDKSSRKWARRYCTLDSNGLLMYFKPGRPVPKKSGLDEGAIDSSTSQSAPLVRGWFTKDSHTMLGKKRKRYFTLTETVVHYFVRESEKGTGEEWKGSIELTALTCIQAPADRGGKILRIDTSDRSWVLEAAGSQTESTTQQVESWVTALTAVIAELKARSSSRRTSTLSTGAVSSDGGGVPNIGPLIGAVNIAEQCNFIDHHPSTKGWPPASRPACRFALVMSPPNDTRTRTINLIGDDPGTAHEWRALMCLVAKCCYCCGKKIEVNLNGGRATQCCAVSDGGLLYHFDCFRCCECPTRPRTASKTDVVLPTELLSVVGDRVYCDKHAGPRQQQAKDRDEPVVELIHVAYRVLTVGKDLDTFIKTVLRKSALLLVSCGEADSAQPETPVEIVNDIGKMFTPEELHRAPQAVLVDIMHRLKDKVITEREAVIELRNVVNDDGTLDVLRFLVVGQKHLFAHTDPATAVCEGVEVLEDTVESVKLRIAVKEADSKVLPNTGVKGFEIMSYRPSTFRKIREVSGIDEGKWSESFGEAPKPGNLLSGGASGCFVVSTPNEQYVMKDMRGSEREVLLSMLPQYLHHLETNPDTLLTRILGLFEVKVADHVTSVVVMTSVIAYHAKLEYHEVYDLKGSFVGRKAIGSKRKESIMQTDTFSGTRKDLDLRRNLILHDPVECDLIKQQLHVDTMFLQGLQLMDYSLVLAIHITDDPEWVPPPRPTGPHGWMSRGFLGMGPEPDSRALHLVGIIDFLQRWNAAKAMENTLKSSFMGQDKHGISAVNPEEYANRFRSVLSGRFEAETSEPA